MNPLASIAALFRRKAADSGIAMRIAPYGIPPARGTRELFQAYRDIAWLRAVTHKIAGAVASVPWQLYAGTAGDDRQEITRHPVLDVLARPNSKLSAHQVRFVTQVWLDMKGEAFWVVERNKQQVPVQVWPLPPHWVRETPSEGIPFFRCILGNYEWKVPESDVVWFKDLNPENPYARGVGMAEALADELDADEYAAKRIKAYFYNQASPEIMVSAQGMGEEEARRAKEKWNEDHRGIFNAFRTYWTGSEIKVTRLDTSFKDMQLVELRRFARDIVIQTFGVPPECLGILENSNRATIDAAWYLFSIGVTVPRVEMWKSELGFKFLPMFQDGERLALEYVSPVPEDREFKLKVYQARPEAFSHNELRKLADEEPVEGWDETYGSAGFSFAQPSASEQMPEPREPAEVEDEDEEKRLPPRRKAAPTASDIENVLERLRAERLTSVVEPVFERRIKAWAKKVLGQLGADARFDLLNPLIPEYLEDLSGKKINGVNDTTRDALRAELTEGVRAGEDVRALSKRVRSVFDVTDQSRAEMIARTEVVGASNWATHESYKVSGVVDKRAWVATRDGRAREEHLALDGVEKELGAKFQIDGYSADYPGGFGDPAMDVNCRCTVVAVIEDPDDGKAVRAVDLDATWKAYDDAIQPWESAAKDALRTGFRAQENDILDALEELA